MDDGLHPTPSRLTTGHHWGEGAKLAEICRADLCATVWGDGGGVLTLLDCPPQPETAAAVAGGLLEEVKAAQGVEGEWN